MIGTDVGNYRILDLVSAGGMGAVYRAQHTLLGRIAAVKVLLPELCSNKDIVQRFFNEAKATTAIKHPGIVEIFDFGYTQLGLAYLVMEFLEGMSLAHRMKLRGRVPEGEAAMVMRGVCSALAAAHAKGIVHRDLKPDNIFVLPDPDSALGERCKLLDFGIAKLTDIGMAGSATKTGAVMGTPTYMSPEQCKGRGNVDHRADLYSIGCILYELVTGVPPFHQQLGAGELIGAHLFMKPDSPQVHVPNLSNEMTALVMKLLEKEPDARVQTAYDLSGYLTQIAQAQGWAVAMEPARASMQMISAGQPGDPTRVYNPTPSPPVFTPVFAMQRTPSHLAPLVPTPAPFTAPPFTVDNKPTTLSTATSEVAPQPVAPKKSKKGLMFGLVGLGLVGGIVVGAVALTNKSGGGEAAPGTTTVPVATQPAPPPPAPVKVEAPPSKPVDPPKPPDPVVEATPKEEPKPVVEAKKPDVVVAKKPDAAVKKPVVVKKPDATKKPDTKPTQPDLIENDL